jgi:uncharacterized protein YdaU (DUF1376 family)
MDPKITQEILDDLIPTLEALEAKSTAVLEFLKHEGVASDEKLAPYLEQAASASNVRWRGVRVRIERLLSAAEKDSAQKRTEKEERKPETVKSKPPEAGQSDSEGRDNSKSAGPENPDESTNDHKNADAMREKVESKSNIGANDSKRKDNNGDRREEVDDESNPAVTGEEKKVA